MPVLAGFMDLTRFDKNSETYLREAMGELSRKESSLGYYQLQGLLFAIACSPEPIKPSEWFELIWLNDEPQFDNEHDARKFYRSVVEQAKHIAAMTRQHRFLPFSPRYDERWQQQLAEWCDGMLMGHLYLEELWLIAVEDLDEKTITDEVDACLALASTFADLDNNQQLSFEEGMELTDDHLPEAYDKFWKLLATYASVGSRWANLNWEFDTEQLFLALEPVAREDVCPCGSGLMFAKCCLH